MAFHSGPSLLSENFLFLAPSLNQTTLADPQIATTVRAASAVGAEQSTHPATRARQFTIVLSAQAPAPFTWLETTNNIRGRFSDNGFLLLPGSVSVTFTADSDTTVGDVEHALIVSSLYHVYQADDGGSKKWSLFVIVMIAVGERARAQCHCRFNVEF